MKCQAAKKECLNEATKVREFPCVGESYLCCDACVAAEIAHYGKDFGWYALTPERALEEERYEEMTKKNMEAYRKAMKEQWKK